MLTMLKNMIMIYLNLINSFNNTLIIFKEII